MAKATGFYSPIKKIKNAVVEKASNVMSWPVRKYYDTKRAVSDIQTSRLKKNRQLKEMDEAGVADKGDERDPLFRYRVNKVNPPKKK